MTMCLPWSIAARAWRMPAGGTPVASTITSTAGKAITPCASGVTWVRPVLNASPSDGAEIACSSHPAVRSWLRPRATSRSATATTWSPRVRLACARNIVPNFPAPMRPTVTGRPAASRSSNMAWRFTETSILPSRDWAAVPRSCQLELGPPHTGRGQFIAVAPLLAHRARDEYLRPAFGFIGRAALEQDFGRTFQLRLGIEALSHLESLAAAECVDRRLTIGTAVSRRRATLARRHDAGIGQADHRVGRILGGVASLTAQLVECLLRALHVRSELGGPLVQPPAERFDQVRLRRKRRQHQWRQRKGACGVRTLGGRWSLIRGLSLLRERGQGQEQRAATDHRVSHGRRSWHSNYSRTAGHHAPIDVAADRSLHRGRGENEEQRNF